MNKKERLFEVISGAVANELPVLEQDQRDILIQQLLNQSLREVQTKVERIAIEQSHLKEEVHQVKQDLNNKVTIDYGQQQSLQNAKKKRVEKLWAEGAVNLNIHDTKRKLHGAAGKALNDAFGVSSYRDIKEKDFDEALNFVKAWKPRLI